MKDKSIALSCVSLALISLALIFLALMIPAPALAQAKPPTPASPWVGLWQAQLDGQPGVLLTLGNDDGQIGGATVFNVASRDGGQPHVIGHDAHALLNPRVEGDTLHFQVICLGDSQTLEMTARMTTDGKATFHCQTCGTDAPEVEITRER